MSGTAAYLRVADIADRLQVKGDTVLGWLHSGALPGFNVASTTNGKRPRWRIDPADLDAFLASRTTGHRPAPTRRRRRSAGPSYF